VRKGRNPVQRLRTAVELLPQRTREAMLLGIERNQIIVGAYSDGEGGICPMLAAHRNGGRTNVASFAKAWDDFTGARRPRRATRREIRALRCYLEMSLLEGDVRGGSLAQLAEGIRAERRETAERRAIEADVVVPGDRNRFAELRLRRRWSWIRPVRRLDIFEATLAAAEEQLAEQSADEVLGEGSDREADLARDWRLPTAPQRQRPHSGAGR
jgi:hypothetical protein